jgi:hypothetical protein
MTCLYNLEPQEIFSFTFLYRYQQLHDNWYNKSHSACPSPEFLSKESMRFAISFR